MDPISIVALVAVGACLVASALRDKERRSEVESAKVRLAVMIERVALAEKHADEAEALYAELSQRTSTEKPITREERDLLVASRCSHCGGAHSSACPRVKRIRFRGDGQTPLEVEFWQDGQWDASRVVWVDDLIDVEGQALIG